MFAIMLIYMLYYIEYIICNIRRSYELHIGQISKERSQGKFHR